MSVAVLGAGAFGTALAIALAREGVAVTLWSHDAEHARSLATKRENARRLPGAPFPATMTPTAALNDAAQANTLLLAVPMQALAGFLNTHCDALVGKTLVACCKGIDLTTHLGPVETIRANLPDATPALLSGPSFAVDIAACLPTALTLAAETDATAQALQNRLSTSTLRLYRTTDTIGTELGGALKNVIAIACGITIGAGLGESARAAILTRGYAEMSRFALRRGARPETLAGLSGLGDLALTCTSDKSRNFAYGQRLGAAGHAEPTATTEGIATARAVAAIARDTGTEMPITAMIATLLDGRITVAQAAEALLARPLKPE